MNTVRIQNIWEFLQETTETLSRARAEYDHLLDELAVEREQRDALLAACKAALNGWEQGGDVWGPMQRLKAAIAKAEGEP